MLQVITRLFLIGSLFGAGVVIGTLYEREKAAKAVTQAAQEARKDEQLKQAVADAITQRKIDDMAVISLALADDLARVRNRADSRNVPENPATDCQGANGFELSKIHARFLTKYAAIAARQNAALKACYSYADSLQN